MNRRLARGAVLAIVIVIVALIARQWLLVRGQTELLEIVVRCPGAELFLDDTWMGTSEFQFDLGMQTDFAHSVLPIMFQSPAIAPIIREWHPEWNVHDEGIWGLSGQVSISGGNSRGVVIHGLVIESEGMLDTPVTILRGTQDARGRSQTYAALLRARGAGGRAITKVSSNLVHGKTTWLDRILGRPSQRLELDLELGPFPEIEGLDSEGRSFGVDMLPLR
jgi:hypothetical protein